MFYYVGYKAKAQIMADEGMAKARKDSRALLLSALGLRLLFIFWGYIVFGYFKVSRIKTSRFMHSKNGGASEWPPEKFLLCVNRPHCLVFRARENS